MVACGVELFGGPLFQGVLAVDLGAGLGAGLLAGVKREDVASRSGLMAAVFVLR